MNNVLKEHSLVKKILDTVKAPLPFNVVYSIELGLFVKDFYQKENGDTGYQIVNVREILFSDSFMNKYNKYILDNGGELNELHINLLQNNLKDPVLFLSKEINL